MNLLVDSQLPAALARHLSSIGISCVHVADIGLDCATDIAIWDYAKSNDMTIVSKDRDFNALANAKGTPPQVIWIRLGNCRRIDLIAAFEMRWKAMQDLLAAGVPVVELR